MDSTVITDEYWKLPEENWHPDDVIVQILVALVSGLECDVSFCGYLENFFMVSSSNVQGLTSH